MTKSDQIRGLAQQGVPIAEIARRLGIRYQFAYGVLSRSAVTPRAAKTRVVLPVKPTLTTQQLTGAGFTLAARWIDSGAGAPSISDKLPKEAGVYAFAVDGVAKYVGLASMGLAKRLYFYERPGVTQRTSLRLNTMLCELLSNEIVCEIYIAIPPDGAWNGLPIDGRAGLELGLIRKFDLPWNKRSTG